MTTASGGPRLSDRQRIAWLRLIRTENVGPASFRALINRFGSADAAIDMLPELAARGGATKPSRIPSANEAERELELTAKVGARIVAMGESDYPPVLRRMENCPPMLTMAGDANVFALPAVAIVGARNASLAGVKMARMLAAELGREGHAIVSGLARGIDTAAHEGGLSTGTVAVLAGGIDQPYPPQNKDLMAAIAARGGAVVTDMPFGWEPRARDFPRRNRIIAGLALGLVVVEAAERSGSLISARMAGEMGRLVFAVPGSPLDPRAGGSNRLLKEGAILVTEAADVAGALRPLGGGAPRPGPVEAEEPADFDALTPVGEQARDRILEALGPTPVGIDEIIRHTGQPAAAVHLVLLELDLAGRLERHSGGAVSLVFADD
ncbi:MAG: DNA-protecting protein DprA [Phyllobacteriaceae bacterium]|nr:DNA-protecting protein DprA [Phyllobacteriaceae bacterium]